MHSESRAAWTKRRKAKLLNITIKLNVINFREFTKVLMKARVRAQLLLPICNYMEGSCFGPGSVEIENYIKSSLFSCALCKVRKRRRKKSMTRLSGITSNQAHPVHTYEPWWAKLAPSLLMRKNQQTNPSHCTWVLNRVLTNGMCGFSCLVIYREF